MKMINIVLFMLLVSVFNVFASNSYNWVRPISTDSGSGSGSGGNDTYLPYQIAYENESNYFLDDVNISKKSLRFLLIGDDASSVDFRLVSSSPSKTNFRFFNDAENTLSLDTATGFQATSWTTIWNATKTNVYHQTKNDFLDAVTITDNTITDSPLTIPKTWTQVASAASPVNIDYTATGGFFVSGQYVINPTLDLSGTTNGIYVFSSAPIRSELILGNNNESSFGNSAGEFIVTSPIEEGVGIITDVNAKSQGSRSITYLYNTNAQDMPIGAFTKATNTYLGSAIGYTGYGFCSNSTANNWSCVGVKGLASSTNGFEIGFLAVPNSLTNDIVAKEKSWGYFGQGHMGMNRGNLYVIEQVDFSTDGLTPADLVYNSTIEEFGFTDIGNAFIQNDLVVNRTLYTDTMKVHSPNGTRFTCTVSNLGVFSCV